MPSCEVTPLGGTDEAYLLLETTVGVVAPMQVVVVLDDDPGPIVAQDLVARLMAVRSTVRSDVPWSRAPVHAGCGRRGPRRPGWTPRR